MGGGLCFREHPLRSSSILAFWLTLGSMSIHIVELLNIRVVYFVESLYRYVVFVHDVSSSHSTGVDEITSRINIIDFF